MIVIVDYRSGNPGSIMNMLKWLGFEAAISSDAEIIEKADKLILPGVGTFDAGMQNINELGLLSVLDYKVIQNRTPILGICLGMQLMAKKSEEGNLAGLGWFDASVAKFSFESIDGPKPKIPHMGWNTIEIKRESSLFCDMYTDSKFYFVHSYYVCPVDQADVLSMTYYGHSFVSSIGHSNILGVQFHPEKSHKHGMKVITNFATLY